MKDEIKEILECIKNTTRDYVGMNGCLYQDLEREELNLLSDYITTLQKENDRLNNIIKEIRELADKYEIGKYDYNVPSFEIKEILDRRINNGIMDKKSR